MDGSIGRGVTQADYAALARCSIAPFRLGVLLDTPALSRADLSSLRTLVYGGALMRAQT